MRKNPLCLGTDCLRRLYSSVVSLTGSTWLQFEAIGDLVWCVMPVKVAFSESQKLLVVVHRNVSLIV